MAKASNSLGSLAEEKKKKKKTKKAAPNAVAMKSKATGDNPFETIWSRRKFDIIGKKRKGEERLICLARSRSIDKRKSTLLKEYVQSGKSSVFVDKRIGEQDAELGEFDKAILRSQRERQIKLKKKKKYYLSDGEEDVLDIQGLGTFSERDDFEDEVQFDDDQAEGDQTDENPSTVNHVNDHRIHAAPTEEDGQKSKSKKEVMDEIIAKSRYFKAEKAKDKEEDAQLLQQLDNDFTVLLQSSGFSSMSRPSKKNEVIVIKNTSDESTKGELLPTIPTTDSSKHRQSHPYDKLVNEMALEIRAHPSDRTKTPEEIAQEERERLERLEVERQKRMLATEDSTDEDDDDANDVPKSSIEKLKSISGDDLGDSFSMDGVRRNKKGWVDEIFEREEADKLNHENSESSTDSDDLESSDDDNGVAGSDNDDNDGDEKTLPPSEDWGQSDDEDFRKDLNDEEEGEEEGGDNRVDAIAPDNGDQGKMIPRHDSLPFLIEAPKDFSELSGLLENKSDADVMEAISRIRKSNAICLTLENKRKIQRFYGLLLQYFAVLASKKPLDVNLLNVLVKPLMEMSVEIPYYAAICARDRLSRTRNLLCEAIKNPEKSCWPSSKTLLLLRLWSLIFPCSDFRHVVMTPAVLLMCEYLTRCPILCGRDIAVGLFLCSMVLLVVKQSKKYCPEAIMFLQTLLVVAMDEKPKACLGLLLNWGMQIRDDSPLLSLQSPADPVSLDFFILMEMDDDSAFFSSDSFRCGIIVLVIETLTGFIDIYKELNSFPEIFSPLETLLLELVGHQHMPPELQDKLKIAARLIEKKMHEHHMLRRPLQMRKHKPAPIKLLNPKFEENFVKGRDYDPDRERVEKRKLKKLVKQEVKGAVRELRKDNYFLFGLKEKERELQEEERSERYGKARAFLEQQEHMFRSGQLGKGRKRRRK